MRPFIRIDNFLEKVDYVKLSERWNLEKPIKHISRKARTYWKQNPDQRIGQVLINLQVIPDSLKAWSDEETDILLDQGILPREVIVWTSYFDKEGNLLDESVERFIKDLDTDHIRAIIKYISSRTNSGVAIQFMEDELKYRNEKEGQKEDL